MTQPGGMGLITTHKTKMSVTSGAWGAVHLNKAQHNV